MRWNVKVNIPTLAAKHTYRISTKDNVDSISSL